MNVLYTFPNRVGVTGIGMTAWHQVTGVAASSVEVTLICGTCDRPVPKGVTVVETMKVGGVRLSYRLLGRELAFQRHDRRVAKLIESMEVRPEVVHAWPGGSLLTLTAAKRLGIPTLLERPNAHTAYAFDVVRNEYNNLGLDMPRSSTHTFDAARLAKEESEYLAADYLACPSGFVARTFLDRGFSEDKLLLHQYGYDPEVYFPDPDFSKRNPKFRVAFIGSCEPRKGLHYALDAWVASGIADVGEFHICGNFVAGYRELLESRLRHPSIKVMGFVADVASVLRNCSALILPSIEEGSALVTYEARASGCVLMVSNASGAHCIHQKNALVHKAGDVGILASQIRALATDPALLKRLRSNSMGDVKALSWDAAASRLTEIYEIVANGRDASVASERI